MLGHVCPKLPAVQKFLAERFEIEQDWETFLGSGLGLTNQKLPFPVEYFTPLFRRLNDENADMRFAAACIFLEAADSVSGPMLSQLVGHIEDETNDVVREKLLRCFIACGAPAVPIAIRAVKTGPNLLRTSWAGVLSLMCSRHPDKFFQAYVEHRDPQLDEAMPWILSGATCFSTEIVQAISEALASESELERSNALRALTSAESNAAAVTPELVDLCLYGSEDEQQRAESILFGFGHAAAPYLRDYNRVRGPSAMEAFQRIQRVLRIPESDVRDMDLVRLRDDDSVRRFVAAVEVLEELGPVGFRTIQAELEQGNRVPPDLGISASRIRTSIDQLEQRLAAFSTENEPVALLAGGEKQPRHLTDTGRFWFDRCREYLRVLDSDVPK